MGKFRTRVSTVEAVQWGGTEFIGGRPDWIEAALDKPWGEVGAMERAIPRREVWIYSMVPDPGLDHRTVSEGDWLVLWSSGRMTIVKRDEFPGMFEPV